MVSSDAATASTRTRQATLSASGSAGPGSPTRRVPAVHLPGTRSAAVCWPSPTSPRGPLEPREYPLFPSAALSRKRPSRRRAYTLSGQRCYRFCEIEEGHGSMARRFIWFVFATGALVAVACGPTTPASPQAAAQAAATNAGTGAAPPTVTGTTHRPQQQCRRPRPRNALDRLLAHDSGSR